MIKITHLFHSGFILETNQHILIFDYFKPEAIDINFSPDYLRSKKKIYIFASHSHPDHFDNKILEWSKINKNINYIFSDDIIINHPNIKHHFMKPLEEKTINDIKIKTHGSTDLGVSFLVEVDDFTIFHAGDLNWWYWKSDTEETHLKEEQDFQNHVNKLKGINIDIAFFPVDPRLQEHYDLGAKYFISTIQPKVIIPMHFGDNYDICKKFNHDISDFNTISPILSNDNKTFIYTKKAR